MFKLIKNKKLRIFIIVIIILFILGLIMSVILNNLKTKYRSFYEVGDEIVFEQDYYNIFNEIDIETKMSDIYIKQSLDNSAKVIIYGEKEYININEKNNKLFIDIKEKNLIAFDFYSFISKIEIYLPQGYNNLIRIDNEFGNIEIDEFINSNFDIESDYSNILIGAANFIKIENDYGNVDVTSVTKARIDNNSGNVKIINIKDLEVINKYGNIKIDNITEYFKLNNEMGDIRIDNIILEKDSFIDLRYGDIEINNISEIYIKAKTEHGKIKINNNYKKSDILLKINNESGDININN